jgi:hypothetical protein
MENQRMQYEQGSLNQDEIDRIFQSLRDYYAQLPVPEEPPAPTEEEIDQFLERTLPIVSQILAMYEICPPQQDAQSSMGWYSRIDESFDQMSRMMNYTFNVWNSFQNLRDVFYPIFRNRERFGRHLTQQEAVLIKNTLYQFQESR